MSLAWYSQCSCPTEPAYSTSEQPRQSTLTNQTQPETRQPALPSPHCVNHGAIASTSPFCIACGCADQSRARPGHRPLLQSLRSDTRHLWILCAHCHGIVLLVSSPSLTWLRCIRPKRSMCPVTNLLLRFEDRDRSRFQSHSGVSVCRVGILRLCTSLAN